MKKTFIYSIIILLAACLASCEKNEGPVGAAEGTITFAPSAVKTRALIEDEAALQAVTFKVYDYLDDAEYINNKVAYSDGAWAYTDEQTYLWKNGTHRLFGFSDGLGTLSEGKVAVSKVLTDQTQDDLLYSEIVKTTAAEWKSAAGHTTETPVSLNMKHLLSAVAITVQNFSGNEVTLNSVSKPAIPNSGSATVDFSGDAVAVEYGEVSVSGDFSTATALSGVTLAAAVEAAEATGDTPAVEAKDGGKADVIAQAVTTDPAYYIVWPQTIEEGSEIAVTVNYTMKGKTYNKTVKIPAGTWSAGKKYNYTLQIFPTDVRLIFKVMPWDSIEVGDIDTSTGSINMTNVTWQNTKVKLTADGEETNTLVNNAYSVYMYKDPYVQSGDSWTQYDGYIPAQGFFTVNYPTSGLFKIELIPAYGQTEEDLDRSKYEIWIYEYPAEGEETGSFRAINADGETITNNTVYFQVRAAASQDGAEHKAQIDILFKPAGEGSEWISAYSEIRANYACVIPATN